MKVGDVVYNEWHGIRRCGIVKDLYKKEECLAVPWTYAKVKWFDDEAYESAVINTNTLRDNGTDVGMYEYRVDKLTQINLEIEFGRLWKIREYKRLER